MGAPARPAAVGSDLSTTCSSAGPEMLSAAAALSSAARTGSSACVKQPYDHTAYTHQRLWPLQLDNNRLLCLRPPPTLRHQCTETLHSENLSASG